ncbi:hypothetical protein [Corynebacterium flavescens]|uniref:hypothetical protein n=1 Tax=Corynebacterium flavescens TaxID=28028 RepID=UPI003FD39964
MFGLEAGSLADWFAAIGTVLAVVTALLQIPLEKRSKRKLEEKSQATQVATWVAKPTAPDTVIAFKNASETPVYNAVVSLVIQSGAGPRTGEEVGKLDPRLELGYRVARSVVPPGSFHVELPASWGGMNRKPGSEIAFTDSKGKHWVRRFDGKLEKLDQDPLATMNYPLPFGDFELKPYSG